MPIPHKVTGEFFIDVSDLDLNLTFEGENVVNDVNISIRQRVNDLMHLVSMIYTAFDPNNIQNTRNSNSSAVNVSHQQMTNHNVRSNGISNLHELDTNDLDFLLRRQRMRYQRVRNENESQLRDEINLNA